MTTADQTAAARAKYEEFCSSIGTTVVADQDAILSSGQGFLPSFAEEVLGGAEPTAEYWDWLHETSFTMHREWVEERNLADMCAALEGRADAIGDRDPQDVAREWIAAGISADQAGEYFAAGCWDANRTAELIAAGVAADDLIRVRGRLSVADGYSVGYAHSNGDLSTAAIAAAIREEEAPTAWVAVANDRGRQYVYGVGETARAARGDGQARSEDSEFEFEVYELPEALAEQIEDRLDDGERVLWPIAPAGR